MTPKLLVYGFIAAVIAAFLGFLGGSQLNSMLADPYDIAVGVVETRVEPTETLAPPTTLPTETASATPGVGECEEPPPGEHCECRLRNSGQSRWFCSLDDEDEDEDEATETPGLLDRVRERREERDRQRNKD